MILPHRAYAFFSHTHKAQKENMPLLDKVSPCLHIFIEENHFVMTFLLLLTLSISMICRYSLRGCHYLIMSLSLGTTGKGCLRSENMLVELDSLTSYVG